MRRILFILLCLLPILGFAQKGFYGGFAANGGTSVIFNQNLYGVKFLYLTSNDKTFDPAHKLTIGYGATGKIGYNFIPPLGLQLEVGYQSAGQKYEDTDGRDVLHKKDIHLSYITTGVYLRYTSIFRKNYYKQNQKVRLALTIGPRINILVNANQTYSLESEIANLLDLDLVDIAYPASNTPFYSTDYSFGKNEDDKNLFKNLDVGLLAKIGVDIYPKKWFFISPTLVSYLSFTDINNKNFTSHRGYGQSRNFSIGFEIGVGFYFDK